MRPNLINRVDLRAKYANGNIVVSTDMNYTTATHHEARAVGELDASTDYWSGAFKNATSGNYTIDLLQPKTYNSIGICLGLGLLQSATVMYSLDNISWITLKTYTNVTHYTIDYTTTGNFIARYIKVNITSPSSIVCLNEIQLFSPENTFEDNILNAVPYGYSAPNNGFWVSEGVFPPSGYQSTRSLYMEDSDNSSTSGDKVISKTGFTPHTTKTLEFMIRPVSINPSGGAIQWRITSGTTIGFRLRTISGSAVQYYNGTSYVTISGASIVAGAWTKIKVIAKVSGTSTISINGGAELTIGKASTAPTTFDGFSFSSGGATITGDKSLFDDVNFYGLTSGNQTSSIAETTTMSNNQLLIVQEEKIRNTNLEVILAPNPANEVVNIMIKNASKGEIDIYFFDISGRKIKTIQLRSNRDTANLDMPIQELQPGMYFITTKQGNRFAQTKLIKK
ncbi:MAG: T9SS type A sorting domain-containing protein [Opitutaceae bacterium]|nr:T9SS type A sorting domain-containing protein [Cytophagales bacterium]